MCRASTSPCDAAEHCDGASNDCPADTGSEPTISLVSLLASTHRSSGVDLGVDVSIEITGENLCSASVLTPALVQEELQPEGGVPASRLSLIHSYASSAALAADYPDGGYWFGINGSTVEGSLPFTAGAPDGSVETLAPALDTTVSGNPTFTISDHCGSCDVVRLSIINDGLAQFVGQTHFTSALPLDTPLDFQLDDLIDSPPSLAEGHYEFHADGIVGPMVHASFSVDPGANVFFYVSGTSLRDETEFTVPEPAAWPRRWERP